jgi:hypothetical protein
MSERRFVIEATLLRKLLILLRFPGLRTSNSTRNQYRSSPTRPAGDC